MVIQSTTLDTEAKVIEVYGGNSWTRITSKFLFGTGTITMYNDSGVATSTNVTAKSTGGSTSSTLTINTMPSHTHTYTTGWGESNSGPSGEVIRYTNKVNGPYTWAVNNTGGSKPHNNMPPYYGVYIWERIS